MEIWQNLGRRDRLYYRLCDHLEFGVQYKPAYKSIIDIFTSDYQHYPPITNLKCTKTCSHVLKLNDHLVRGYILEGVACESNRHMSNGEGGPITHHHRIPGPPYLSLTRDWLARGQMVSSPLQSISYDGRLSHNLRRNGRLRDRLIEGGARCRKWGKHCSDSKNNEDSGISASVWNEYRVTRQVDYKLLLTTKHTVTSQYRFLRLKHNNLISTKATNQPYGSPCSKVCIQ